MLASSLIHHGASTNGFDLRPVLFVQSDVACQVYRSYRGRVDRVTDVIRCAIVFASVDELVKFMEVIQVCV